MHDGDPNWKVAPSRPRRGISARDGRRGALAPVSSPGQYLGSLITILQRVQDQDGDDVDASVLQKCISALSEIHELALRQGGPLSTADAGRVGSAINSLLPFVSKDSSGLLPKSIVHVCSYVADGWFVAHPREPFLFLSELGNALRPSPSEARMRRVIFRLVCCIRDLGESALRSDKAALEDAISVSLPHIVTLGRSVLFHPASGSLKPWSSSSDAEHAAPETGRLDFSSSQADRESETDSLRVAGLQMLLPFAKACASMFIPHLPSLLPERDGIAQSANREATGSLAHIILFDPSRNSRACAVTLTATLIRGTGKLARRSVPSSAGNVSSFTPAGARIARISSVLYSVVATALRREESNEVLPRLIKLATELARNVRVPVVAPGKIHGLVLALRCRIFEDGRMDYTSESASLACMSTLLSANSTSISAELIGDDQLVQSLRETITRGAGADAPVEEALSVLSALAEATPRSIVTCWPDLAKDTSCLLVWGEQGDCHQALILHVIRLYGAALAAHQTVICQSAPADRQPCSSGFADTLASWIREHLTHHLTRALGCRFRAVRLGGLQVTEAALETCLAIENHVADRTALHDAAQFIAELAWSTACANDEDSVSVSAMRAMSKVPIWADSTVLWYSTVRKLSAELSNVSTERLKSSRYLALSTLLSRRLDMMPQDHERASSAIANEELAVMEDLYDQTLVCVRRDQSMSSVDGKARTTAWPTALWALGCAVRYLVCVAQPGRPTEARADVRSGLSILIDTLENATESDKARWYSSSILGHLADDQLRVNPGQVTSVGTLWVDSLSALLHAVRTTQNYRLMCRSVASVRSILCLGPGALVGPVHHADTLATCLIAWQAHSQSACHPEHSGRAQDVAQSRDSALAELRNAIIDVLNLPSEVCGSHGEVPEKDALFQVLWEETRLPAFALRALGRPGPTLLTEEDQLARDVWRTVSPRLVNAFRNAATMRNQGVEECVAGQRLSAAAALVANANGT